MLYHSEFPAAKNPLELALRAMLNRMCRQTSVMKTPTEGTFSLKKADTMNQNKDPKYHLLAALLGEDSQQDKVSSRPYPNLLDRALFADLYPDCLSWAP